MAVGLSLLAVLLVGAAPTILAATGGGTATYDNVQLQIHTSNSTFTGTYTVTAYNSTGAALVTYQTPYPSASFELPPASYIFTVSAFSSQQYPVACPLETSSGVGQSASGSSSSPPVASGASAGTATTITAILPPCKPGYFGQSEYGFAVQQVSGPTTLTISTKPISEIPTATLTVSVKFMNGTAAAGTNVYASMLGGEAYPIYAANSANMSGMTGSDGTVSLVVPAVPVEMTAWNWVPVNLPQTPPSTVQVNVGGQNVNVTVYWQPSYVGLAGSALVVPPQTTANITLRVQQQSYWATPAGVSSGAGASAVSSATAGSAAPGVRTTTATVASQPTLIPASLASQEQQQTPQQEVSATASSASSSVQQQQQQQTPSSSVQTIVSTATVTEGLPVTQTVTVSSSPTNAVSSNNYETVLLTVVGALALGIAAASLIIVRRRTEI